jgi:hypothetical protein
MPPVIMSIKMDGNSMIARVYKSREHLKQDDVLDYWEVSFIMVDDEVLEYLEDNKLTAAMIRRHKTKEVKNDRVHYPLSD